MSGICLLCGTIVDPLPILPSAELIETPMAKFNRLAQASFVHVLTDHQDIALGPLNTLMGAVSTYASTLCLALAAGSAEELQLEARRQLHEMLEWLHWSPLERTLVMREPESSSNPIG